MTSRPPSPAHYQFITRWEFEAPLARVWRELMTPEEWPQWWPGVEKVELVRPGDDELGHGAQPQALCMGYDRLPLHDSWRVTLL